MQETTPEKSEAGEEILRVQGIVSTEIPLRYIRYIED
jgi:hypothetical protein